MQAMLRTSAVIESATGNVLAMLVYNLAAVILLAAARFCQGVTGKGWVPVGVLHAAPAVWGVVVLRSGVRAS